MTGDIHLVQPGPQHHAQVMDARTILFIDGADDGLAGLIDCDTYEEWLDFRGRGLRTYGDGYVESTTYLAIRTDGTLVGFLDLRHELSDFLLNYGGHIGYSVLPEYRRHGYAKAMLGEALDKARNLGLSRVLVTCHDDNVASERTIIANGGVLENVTILEGIRIKRFWIDIE